MEQFASVHQNAISLISFKNIYDTHISSMWKMSGAPRSLVTQTYCIIIQ